MTETGADNPARPPAGVRLCALAEITDPGARSFRFREGETLFAGFVVRKGPVVAGYVDSCPHAGWPLAAFGDRYLNRREEHILCGGHGALFRIADGYCVAGPCAGAWLPTWPIVVQDGDILTA